MPGKRWTLAKCFVGGLFLLLYTFLADRIIQEDHLKVKWPLNNIVTSLRSFLPDARRFLDNSSKGPSMKSLDCLIVHLGQPLLNLECSNTWWDWKISLDPFLTKASAISLSWIPVWVATQWSTSLLRQDRICIAWTLCFMSQGFAKLPDWAYTHLIPCIAPLYIALCTDSNCKGIMCTKCERQQALPGSNCARACRRPVSLSGPVYTKVQPSWLNSRGSNQWQILA
jgi:hypothetical protein